MAAHDCVVCGLATPPGAVECPHCGADHPHRQRPRRAQALARRRQLVLLGVLAGVVVLGLVVVLTGGGGRSKQCLAYDAAQARYDQAVSSGEEDAADLGAAADRLHAACAASER